jgi:hypothetical protein
VAGLDGFRQGHVIPERMRKRVEEYEACINAGAQIGAMYCRSAEQRISAAGKEERRRQTVQVCHDNEQRWQSAVSKIAKLLEE